MPQEKGPPSHIYLPIANVRGRGNCNPVSIYCFVHCLKEADVYLPLRNKFIIKTFLEIVSQSALSKHSPQILKETSIRQL